MDASKQKTLMESLEDYRERNELSIQSLASRIGVGAVTYWRWNTGVSQVSSLAINSIKAVSPELAATITGLEQKTEKEASK